MLNKFKKQMKNEKGLTLIELLAVIVIIAIVAIIAVPAIGNIISNSQDSAKLAAASNILAGAKIAALDGMCEADATTSTTITCKKDVLADGYVENVKDGATLNYEATSAAGVWSVTYAGAVDFTSKKYKDLKLPTGGVLTEHGLNLVLDGKEYVATPPVGP